VPFIRFTYNSLAEVPLRGPGPERGQTRDVLFLRIKRTAQVPRISEQEIQKDAARFVWQPEDAFDRCHITRFHVHLPV
jgi:hypothetical protein